MKGTEAGKDKVRKICEALRKETLEPAKVEADEIIHHAREQAEQVVERARREAEEIIKAARQGIEKEKNVFESSLGQACKQALESLRQQIEKLFDQQLIAQLLKETADAKVIGALVNAVILSVKNQGIEGDLSVYIPAVIPAREVNICLLQEVLQALKEKSVLLSSIGGGIELKLHQDRMTIDLSAAALKELVATYIRKDFREMIFQA